MEKISLKFWGKYITWEDDQAIIYVWRQLKDSQEYEEWEKNYNSHNHPGKKKKKSLEKLCQQRNKSEHSRLKKGKYNKKKWAIKPVKLKVIV